MPGCWPARWPSSDRTRPLGLDRLGLRLRIEAIAPPVGAPPVGGPPVGDHDVRLAFQRPADDHEQLRTQIGLLIGYPMRG